MSLVAKKLPFSDMLPISLSYVAERLKFIANGNAKPMLRFMRTCAAAI